MSDEMRGDGNGPDPEGVQLGIGGFRGAVEVGRGGFGAVYRAYQPKFNRTVAIKVLSGAAVDARTRERFERERMAMGALSSQPNIMTVYDAGFTEFGHPYIVMEYTPAGSLAEVMATRGPFSAEETASIGVRMAEALASAHEAGILHRDVKPENIMVSPYGEPLLSDFGIARMMSGPATRTGNVTASLDHAAPEVLEGKKPSEASDVYSLASSLYGLVVGTAPFRKETDESLAPMLTRIMTTDVPDPDRSVMPAAVFAELKRAMSKDPAERHGSATQFADALRSAAHAAGLVLGPVRLDAPGTVVTAGVDVPDEEQEDASKTYVYARIPRVEEDPAGAERDPATPASGDSDAAAGTPGLKSSDGSDTSGEGSEDRRKLLVFGVAALVVLLSGAGAFALVRDGGQEEPAASVAEGDPGDDQDASVEEAVATSEDVPPEEATFEVAAGEAVTIPAPTGTTLAVVSDPEHGTAVTESDGSLTYTADADFSGEDSFLYESCDPDGECGEFRAIIAVAGNNPAPVVVDDTAETTAPETVTVPVLDNDTDDDGLDNETLRVVTEPANGTAEANPDGTVDYTPEASFAGTDTFDYEICDQADNPACSRASARIAVAAAPALAAEAPDTTPPRTPESTPEGPTTTAPRTVPRPTATNDAKTVDEDKTGTWDLLANDNGTVTSWTIKTKPSNGSATKSGNNLSYTPKANYNGSDSLTYEACNSTGCDTATLAITVRPVNDAPNVPDYSRSGFSALKPGNTRYVFPVLTNADDVEDGKSGLRITSVSCGNVRCGKEGSQEVWTTPTRGGVTDSFTFTVCDSADACQTATGTITYPSNLFYPDAVGTDLGSQDDKTGGTWTFRPLCNDSDRDGDAVWIRSVSASVGSVTTSTNMQYCSINGGTPNVYVWDAGGYHGPVTFTYTITDGEYTDTATDRFCVESPINPVYC